nr:GAF domain-containing protein [Methylomicrobium sp. RS1]
MSDPIEIQQAAMRVVGEHLKVDCVQYGEIDNETMIIADSYARGGFPKLSGEFPMRRFSNAVKILQRGETLVVEDIRNQSGYSEAELASFAALKIVSIVCIPFVKAGHWLAAFAIHHGSPRQWRPDEIAILQEAAERIWAAIERARAEERLRRSLDELTRFNSLVVGRELRMIELKKEVNDLSRRLDGEQRYPLEFELPKDGDEHQ